MAELPNRGGEVRQNWRGTITANGATPVQFFDLSISPKACIHLTLKTVGGTPAAMIIQSVTLGSGNTPGSFTVSSTAGNTSTYNCHIYG